MWFEIACTDAQAKILISIRPFHNVVDLETRIRSKKGVSAKIWTTYSILMEGYNEVDNCLSKCERVGDKLGRLTKVMEEEKVKAEQSQSTSIASASITPLGTGASAAEPMVVDDNSDVRSEALSGYIREQPKDLKNIQLKDYQMAGLNWINLLYRERISCILADEMGE